MYNRGNFFAFPEGFEYHLTVNVKPTDRKSGSAGMPRPISSLYLVCRLLLEKKKETRRGCWEVSDDSGSPTMNSLFLYFFF